jgi:phage host-nuclease inhibitor protein Gam
MELMREAWTDERLDDLTNRMDRGFDRVDADIRELRSEMREEFTAVRTEMKDEFALVRGEMNQQVGSLREETVALWGEVNTRLDGIQQTMIRFNGALLVSLVALILAVLLRGG